MVANQLQQQYDDGYVKVKVSTTLLIAYHRQNPKLTPAPLEKLVQALASPAPIPTGLSVSPTKPTTLPSPSSHPLTFSLQLLALPMANRLREGLQLVVKSFPQVAFEYARQFCRHSNQWAILLDELLKVSQGNPAGIGTVYEQIVEYLTENMDPEAFLNLLPAQGHLLYFLPYPVLQ